MAERGVDMSVNAEGDDQRERHHVRLRQNLGGRASSRILVRAGQEEEGME